MSIRPIYFLSDSTGLTAEGLGSSLLTQFQNLTFKTKTIPFIDSEEKALSIVSEINEAYQATTSKPIIFATLADPKIRKIIATSQGLLMDFFDTFLNPLADELQCEWTHQTGKAHGIDNYERYKARIDAVNFALNCDDGIRSQEYAKADIILVGVSRCGKTPTSLYLALQFGLSVANYPLTEDDVDQSELPSVLKPYQMKLFGLTIDANRLQRIRQERRPNSHYADLQQCQHELKQAERLFKAKNISFLNTTNRSIEEIATQIIAITGLERKNK